VHTIHFPTAAFRWTHTTGAAALDAFVNPTKPHKTRFRCRTCGCCIASANARTSKTSVWGAQLARGTDVDARITRYALVAPTAHMFYGTRMLDVPDGVPKWAGYPGSSERMA
jgi:hypothetical protein